MKEIIYIAGATGLIGKELSLKLHKRGYKVGIITRDMDSARQEVPFASKIIETDYSYSKFFEQVQDAKAIINLAGTPIAGKRWNNSYKNKIYNSRIDTTKALVNAINNLDDKPEVFISTSAVGYYGDRGNEKLLENSKPGNDFLAKVCIDWENEAKKSNTRNVIGRIGVVLSDNGGALPQMALPYKLFVGGRLGNGKQWFPWIHIDDLTELFIHFIENKKSDGAYNLTSPGIVTNKEFSKALSRTLKRPELFPVPEFMLKLMLGESADFILSSLKAIPQKALNDGYEFNYNTIDIALFDLLK